MWSDWCAGKRGINQAVAFFFDHFKNWKTALTISQKSFEDESNLVFMLFEYLMLCNERFEV